MRRSSTVAEAAPVNLNKRICIRIICKCIYECTPHHPRSQGWASRYHMQTADKMLFFCFLVIVVMSHVFSSVYLQK